MSATPTLVSISQREIGDRRFLHGDEIEPGVLTGELLDYWLDHKWCMELPERRSLYRLFAPLSGCTEKEELTEQEQAEVCLPE